MNTCIYIAPVKQKSSEALELNLYWIMGHWFVCFSFWLRVLD